MTRARWLLIAIVTAVAVASYFSMPPAAGTLPITTALPAPVRGAIHIHTRRSDGTGSVDQVAAAAARAGLNFIILTDHGDGTREPDPPTYRHGVLCIDAVEISTHHGHLVALGLPRSPYPLAGEGRDVVEDVRRMGGMSIAAHPTSAKAELQWTDWDVRLDGLEWMNADSEWRDESLLALPRVLLTYPFRRAETLATILDRPDEALRRWDSLTARRPTVALAGSDAHARIALTSVGEPYDNRIALPIPGYERIFRTFSIALPGVSLTMDARVDAQTVLDAIRRGRVFSSVEAVAGPAAVSFSASGEGLHVAMGDTITLNGSATLRVKTNASPGSTLALIRNGQIVQTATESQLEYPASEPGAYRVEIQRSDAPGTPSVPWVVSNPIYVTAPAAKPGETAIAAAPVKTLESLYTDGPATGWRVETSMRSRGALDVVSAVGGTQLLFRYAIGGAEADSPFAAVAMPVATGLSGYDRLVFAARSIRPARIWVYLRMPGGSWRRSVFIEEGGQTVIVPFSEMRPMDASTTGSPVLADVRDVLFVVDTINTRPGTNGQLWLDDVKVGK
jgi:hypothetical protein